VSYDHKGQTYGLFSFPAKERTEKKVGRYFLQDTPLAGLERMMMQIPRTTENTGGDKGCDGIEMNTKRRCRSRPLAPEVRRMMGDYHFAINVIVIFGARPWSFSHALRK
jgi:hypothetical protein